MQSWQRQIVPPATQRCEPQTGDIQWPATHMHECDVQRSSLVSGQGEFRRTEMEFGGWQLAGEVVDDVALAGVDLVDQFPDMGGAVPQGEPVALYGDIDTLIDAGQLIVGQFAHHLIRQATVTIAHQEPRPPEIAATVSDDDLDLIWNPGAGVQFVGPYLRMCLNQRFAAPTAETIIRLPAPAMAMGTQVHSDQFGL